MQKKREKESKRTLSAMVKGNGISAEGCKGLVPQPVHYAEVFCGCLITL
jgi:hypothetical protein